MKIIKNKGYIILLGIILILTFFLYKQNCRYKETVAGYDIVTLSNLENEIEALVYKSDNNQLTDEGYLHHKRVIKAILVPLSKSPNVRFMHYPIHRRILHSNNRNEFIEENLVKFRNLQEKIDSILKEYSDGIDVYNYFKNESNKEEFLEMIK